MIHLFSYLSLALSLLLSLSLSISCSLSICAYTISLSLSESTLDSNGNAEVVKTGMGSSAALATSLVGALLQWFGVIRLGQRAGGEDRRVLHNLAQLAHAVAQGKIGSGFDVAAAVYGTQMYRRFSAEVSFSLVLNTSYF